MKTNIVLNVIEQAFKLEIANKFIVEKNSIVVNLADGSMAKIITKSID